MRTIVLGIGNLILSDDAVGIRVAQTIGKQIPNLYVATTSGVGVNLLDHVIGYDRLIIIDSIKLQNATAGDVYKLSLDDLESSLDLTPLHGMNIATTIKFGRGLGYDIPSKIIIYAIQIVDNSTFQEQCTPQIENQIPKIASDIIEEEHLCRTHSCK